MATSHMYDDTDTWSPFKGCTFDCSYCKPSFQAQAKRLKHLCGQCYQYAPHLHEERLAKIPSAKTVFVCGNADICFCPPDFTRKIIAAIKVCNSKNPGKTYFFQSKQPACFEPFLAELPSNAILLTTLETNRDEGYGEISKAPVPSERYTQFRALRYPRKVVTIEPVMDFDVDVLGARIIDLRPEYVWLGLNSRPQFVRLPEPSGDKLRALAAMLTRAGIAIRGKELRGLDLGVPSLT
jgi:hypothetical protein